MIRLLVRLGAALVVLNLGVSTASALTFNFTNQGGASPQMVAGFAQAGAMWSAQFNDPITVNVRINAAALSNGIIAHTDSFYDPYSYTAVRNALVTDRQSVDDFFSTNNLQPGSAFSMLINRTANNPNGVVSATPYFDTGLGGPGQAGPENNNTVRITSANAKALGLYPANSAGLDGMITFTTALSFDFDRSNGINAAQIDFVGVAAHELGHMLGFVSGVDILAGNGTAPGLNDNQLKFVTPLDLFRFSSRSIGAGGGVGVNDWTDDDTAKYFSVDGGATSLAAFSTGTTFEASHWKDNLGIGIMDPTAGAGELLLITNNDRRAFDVIGYNPIQGTKGDMNSDGVVNNFDISPFELALTNSAIYLATYPSMTDAKRVYRGDIGGDFSFNNFDISPFETLLTGSPVVAVPEPAGLFLSGIGSLMLAVFCLPRKQRRHVGFERSASLRGR